MAKSDVPSAEKGDMHWAQAGLILFAFASPSAILGAGFSVGRTGLAGGPLLCVVVTVASALGSVMLLRLREVFPGARTLGDLGREVLGRPGKLWGDTIQIGNFVLFLPVALLVCGISLEGVVDIKAFGGNSKYYILLISLPCLAATQLRTLSNTVILTYASLICVLGMCALQVFAATKYPEPSRERAQWFGNPREHSDMGTAEALLGATTTVWAYVPAFLTVELSLGMQRPMRMVRSLWFSGVLNVVLFAGVGAFAVVRWGYELQEPINFTPIAAWARNGWVHWLLSVFLLMCNFVSYALDAVPLARFCQRAWAPQFADTWSYADMFRYLGYSMPTFLFGLVLALVVPNLFVMLAFTTALTVPWATQIYPAVLYWRFLAGRIHAQADVETSDTKPCRGAAMSRGDVCLVAGVLSVGVASFVVCVAAAIAKVAIARVH